MDQAFYQQWWPLHLRTVRGETLPPKEKALYVSGLKELEAQETFPGQEQALRRLQEEIQKTASDNARLEKRRQELESEIRALQILLRNKQPV
jgi:hypothetical protein